MGTSAARVAAIAQLGERQTEDLKVPGSIPGLGIYLQVFTCNKYTDDPCRMWSWFIISFHRSVSQTVIDKKRSQGGSNSRP